jgi:hypothetical protein
MLSFLKFIQTVELTEEYIAEAVNQNTMGVMHELLVGYHLNGSKHMDRHPDINGDGPKEAHDKLKSSMDKEDYKKINARAKLAAEHIKTQLGGKPIHKVQWTSKPGDLHKATGIHASQKEDASDIVVTTKDKSHPSGFKHHGVSLKVTSGKTEIPVSNPGLESTQGGADILKKHREKLLQKHPKLRTASNKSERKAVMAANPKIEASVKKENATVLTGIAKNMHQKLSAMPKKKLVDHLRNTVLAAKPTPMQEQGHVHIRYTSYGDDTHSAINPAEAHEHIFKTPQHITMAHSGTSVIFSHKGIPFARHRLKFESQSDPLSTVKGSGELIKRKMDQK